MSIINDYHQKFNKPKAKAVKISKFFHETHKEHTKLNECARSLFISVYQHKINKDDFKNKVSTFMCKSKFCPFCELAKNTKWKIAIQKRIEELRETKQRYVFLTLSPKTVPLTQLRSTIKNMQKAWKSLWINSLKYRMNGYVKRLEITYSKIDGVTYAHPHFHILISVNPDYFKNYFTQREISEKFTRLYGQDINVMTDIQAINRNIKKTLKELLKYVQKSTDLAKLSKDEMSLLVEELKNLRLIETGGNFSMSEKKIDETNVEAVEIEMQLWELYATYSAYFDKETQEYYGGRLSLVSENSVSPPS